MAREQSYCQNHFKTCFFMKTRDAVFAQNRQRPFFTFWWISTSRKTPRAGRHTGGCVLTWEYVCYKFRIFLRRESRVMAISVLKPVFSENVAFPVLMCLMWLLEYMFLTCFGNRHLLLCLDQSATGKMTVPTVGSFHSFSQKVTLTCIYQSDSRFLRKPCFQFFLFIDLILCT